MGFKFRLLSRFFCAIFFLTCRIDFAFAQSVTEFTTAKGENIVVGGDGNLWVSSAREDTIYRVSPSGQTTRFELSSSASGPVGLTKGPDGNVWYADNALNTIGRISPFGNIKEFEIPDSIPGAGPWGITMGPDGNIWFAAQSANKIVRMTLDGQFTAFSLSAGEGPPKNITTGYDGALWFTTTGSRIGRVTTEGAFTFFNSPASAAHSIVLGFDDAMWYTIGNGGEILRLSADGRIQRFAPASRPTRFNSIAKGPDGNLWFAISSDHRLGRITPDGVITEFPLPSSQNNAEGVITGPDGNIWFTGHDGIGKLVPPVPGVQGGIVFSSAQDDSESYLRFFNDDVSAGTVNVDISDARSGLPLGKWTSPPIAAGAEIQVHIRDIETNLGIANQQVPFYSIAVSSAQRGYFQNVLWRRTDGTLTNLSNCGNQVEVPRTKLFGVHSSLLDYGYPSSIAVFSTARKPATVTLNIHNTINGKFISSYTTDEIPPQGHITVPLRTIEAKAGMVPERETLHYALKADDKFNGFLQHLVVNQAAGVITDMTAACTFDERNFFTSSLISEFPVPDYQSSAASIALGPDNNMWIGYFSSKIYKFTPGGTYSVFNMPGGAVQKGTAGPDGNFWYVTYSNHKVGKVDLAGNFTEFTIPTPEARPNGITVGPDNALWFTETGGNKIGRITTSGQIQEFELPKNTFPYSIALGPDKNLWFTTSPFVIDPQIIGRITVNGEVKLFKAPSRAVGGEIVAGKDGAMWFTQSFSGQVGRITTAGEVTEYKIPTRARRSIPFSLAVGADSNIWVADGNRERPAIWRVTPSGEMTEYPIGTPGYGSLFLAADTEGAIWFPVSTSAKGRVGRIYPPSRGRKTGAVFSSVQADTKSFFRFFNAGNSGGSVDVDIIDGLSGTKIGTWTSPPIPSKAELQVSVSSIEDAIVPKESRPESYSVAVNSTIPGFFQHVAWRSSDGTLTNLSTCDADISVPRAALFGVHSSLLEDSYPSSVVIANTGKEIANVTIGIYNAATGAKLGTYSVKNVPSRGQAVTSISSIEMQSSVTPSAGMFHYNLVVEGEFQGFLQHLVTNKEAGAITDMTIACKL